MEAGPWTKKQRSEIVYLVTTFEPEVGGTVTQTGNQARALAGRGHRVTVMTRRTRAELPRLEERDGIRIRRFGHGNGRGHELVTMLLWAAWLLQQRRRVAVVQVVMHPEFLWCAAWAGLLARTSMLWVTGGDADGGLASKGSWAAVAFGGARRFVVKRSHNIVLTPGMADEVAPYSDTPPIVVPVPVDVEHFRPPTRDERERARSNLGVGASETLFVYSGHLEPRKGLHHLIGALGAMQAGGIKLCVVGGERLSEHGYAAGLRADVDRLGLNDCVNFAGYARDVRDPFLWAADIFVLPSEREGMPNAVLEAMACGLPCILPSSAGGDELLNPSFGEIPLENSPAELEGAVRSILERRPEWGSMGRIARETAERYSVSRVTDQYENVYDELGRR